MCKLMRANLGSESIVEAIGWKGSGCLGGIEEGNRKSFMFAADERSEATLLPIIETFIEKGTTIISDCWKAILQLGKTWLQASDGKPFEGVCEQ